MSDIIADITTISPDTNSGGHYYFVIREEELESDLAELLELLKKDSLELFQKAKEKGV